MTDDQGTFKWLGPLATPIAVAASLVALVGTFRAYADTLGWRTVSAICVAASVGWSGWYLLSTVAPRPVVLTSVAPRNVWRHPHRGWRALAFGLPVLAAALFAGAFVWSQEPDYSALLEGGGPYSPMVVFDSVPRGAEVRLAWSLYGEDDPWLQGKGDKITRLPQRTLTRARLSQGHYWIVFELNGRRVQKHLILTAPIVVKVHF